jgi:hypothetical protein
MWKVLLNQLHLLKWRARLWVMLLETPWARRRERLWEKQKAKT